jgi:uncharacterized protein DUF4396
MDHLGPLAQPAVVVAWYAAGLAGAAWVISDEYRVNTRLPEAMKWAWPIIVVFFSIMDLALCLWTARPCGMAQAPEEERERLYEQHASSTFNRVTGAVIHCVGGDGLGPVADAPVGALWMGGRAEFFSMMAVMAGMGAVMAYVTPLVVGQQPSRATAAFWGFAAMGLFAGFVPTYPMNWWLVKIG